MRVRDILTVRYGARLVERVGLVLDQLDTAFWRHAHNIDAGTGTRNYDSMVSVRITPNAVKTSVPRDNMVPNPKYKFVFIRGSCVHPQSVIIWVHLLRSDGEPMPSYTELSYADRAGDHICCRQRL